MKRISNRLLMKTTIDAISNTIFFAKVSQLVNTQASPKQPQSDTGLNSAKYKVNGVITTISIKAKADANDLLTPKSKNIPTENSIPDNIIPPNKGKKEGIHEESPNAAK